jgi:hypothetical protein
MPKTRGVKVLGLVALASLAVMACSAATAQAAKWLVLGAAITANHTFTLSAPGGLILLMPAYNLELKCSNGSGSGTMLSAGAKDVGHFTFTPTGCKVFSLEPLQEMTVCSVEILPISDTVLAIGTDLVLFEHSKKEFPPLHFKGEECPFASLYFFGGTFRALVENNNTAAPVFNTMIGQVDDTLTVGVFPVVLDAKLVALLTTAGDVDKPFGVS